MAGQFSDLHEQVREVDSYDTDDDGTGYDFVMIVAVVMVMTMKINVSTADCRLAAVVV